jgi:hypothetical protein
VELYHPLYAYTRCDAIPFGTRYAVYDPVLRVWSVSDISLHGLRLDLHHPKSLFSSCPSRRRAESEGTIRDSPVLRVFVQNGEEVAGTKGLNAHAAVSRMPYLRVDSRVPLLCYVRLSNRLLVHGCELRTRSQGTQGETGPR